MKPYLKEPITNLDQAHRFFDQLWRDGLLFHPEDDPALILAPGGSVYLFTMSEATELTNRIAEVYRFDLNPCAYCLGLLGAHEGPNDRNKPPS